MAKVFRAVSCYLRIAMVLFRFNKDPNVYLTNSLRVLQKGQNYNLISSEDRGMILVNQALSK
jgi:hypothetical protein